MKIKFYQLSKVFIIGLFLLNTKAANSQCGQRYHDKIFLDSVVSNIQYGANLRSTNVNQNLLLDIYFPKGDSQTNRPLVIIAHGGNFLGGSKTGIDVLPFAKDLAQMGYVTSSIEYRVGMTNFPLPGPDSTDAGEAVMRAVHDQKAAVRFFKDSYANGNPYGIDTSLIFVAGVSAGGFMALHTAYMNDMSEFPTYIDTVNQYGLSGGVEGISNNLPYNSNVAGVINICGAIGDTAWIDAGDAPVLSFHGTNDGTVPYGSAEITLLGLYPLLQVDGSESITLRANQKGIENCFEIYEGQDHTPHVSGSNQAAYYDTTLNITRNFLAHYVCGESLNCSYGPTITSVNELQKFEEVSVYPNPATHQVEVLLANEELPAQVSLYDIHGKLIETFSTSSSKTIINRNDLPSGMYLLRIDAKSKNYSSRIIFE